MLKDPKGNPKPQAVEMLYKIFHKLYTAPELPDEWVLSMICPLYKKGDKLE